MKLKKTRTIYYFDKKQFRFFFWKISLPVFVIKAVYAPEGQGSISSDLAPDR